MGDDLQEMDARIERLDAECMTAEGNVDDARKRMNAAWESLTEHQASYRRYKQEADEEFRLSRESWDNGDRAAAKVYSNSGHALNAKRRECSRAIDEARAKYDECRDEFEAAKSARDSLRKRLRGLRAKRAEQGHWHEKACAECGETIRYDDRWEHVPNYCRACRERFDRTREDEDKKWAEKQCRECGGTIRYRVDWEHIPNYCKACKERFAKDTGQDHDGTQAGSPEFKLRFKPESGRNDFYFGSDDPHPGDGHGHVVVDDEGEVHYVRDTYRPKHMADRRKAVSYDDGVYL